MRQIKPTEKMSIPDVFASTTPSLPKALRIRLAHELSIARKAEGRLAVFVVRIDGYHHLAVNLDVHVLDMAVTQLVNNLKAALGPADSIRRVRDDCFIVIQPLVNDAFIVHDSATRMLKSLQQPIRVGDSELCLNTSIGVAMFPDDGNKTTLLFERAYGALERTRRWGGNGFCFHSRSTARTVAVGLSMDEDLRTALNASALSLRFQPILELSKACVEGASGDICWDHLERGRQDFSDILQSAERADLIPKLNAWLVEQICRQASSWSRTGNDRRISFEVRRPQIDGGLAATISKRIRTADAQIDLLEICVDHTLLHDRTDHRLRTELQQIADLGVNLCVTNVGTGALAIADLAELPIRRVELAPPMIASIGRSAELETMLGAIMRLFQDIGLGIRATGVATREQLCTLQHHGCDEIKGPLLAPALEALDVDRLTAIRQSFDAEAGLKSKTSLRLSVH